MHRTQILLEDAHYEALREQARREGKSIGQLIRQSVNLAMEVTRGKPKNVQKSLASLKGMFHKPGIRGRDHNRLLYGDSS